MLKLSRKALWELGLETVNDGTNVASVNPGSRMNLVIIPTTGCSFSGKFYFNEVKVQRVNQVFLRHAWLQNHTWVKQTFHHCLTSAVWCVGVIAAGSLDRVLPPVVSVSRLSQQSLHFISLCIPLHRVMHIRSLQLLQVVPSSPVFHWFKSRTPQKGSTAEPASWNYP